MAYVYIGRTFKTEDLSANKIYCEKPRELIEKFKMRGASLIEQLFVPAEEMATAKEEVLRRGTARNEARKQLEFIIAKGGKN